MMMDKTKTLKQILTTFVMLVGLSAVTNVQAQVTEEDGTEAHPYLIENLQELMDFHDCMVPGNIFYHSNGTFTRTQPSGTEGVDYRKIPQGCKETYVKLTADIVVNTGNIPGCDGVKDPSWTVWTPMDIFYGYFDGDYHVISGLYCTTRDSSATNNRHERGFFTQLSDSAKVKRLGITNSYISGARAVGGITGWMLNKSEVSECFFEGTLATTDINTGGIVGIAESRSVVKDCYSTGNIFANKHYVGGIAGIIESGVSLINCYSNMIIESDGSLTTAICGHKQEDGGCVVNNCYYDKQLSTVNTADYGAYGMLTSEMTRSYWTTLGEKFESANGLYPRIKGFSMSNPSVAMSVIPIFLESVDIAQYDDVSNLYNDFTLGSYPGATWQVDSWNDCITLSGSDANLGKQGVADLMVKLDTLTRTYTLYPNVAPFLGSETNPFIIDNYTDLTNFRKGIKGGLDFKYRRCKVVYSNLENIHWLQTSDISVGSEANWEPVGTSVFPFKGYYHGGDHSINDLKITSGNYKAFFGYTKKAYIEKLSVHGNVSGGIVSLLCGRMLGGTLSHCSTFGTVNSTSSTGGMVGYLTDTTIVLSYCHNDAKVVAASHAGGLTGDGMSINTYLYDCWNTGNVQGASWVGGVYGFTNDYSSTVKKVIVARCYNLGDVTGTSTGSTSDVGGIVGVPTSHASNSVSFCYNKGTIKGGGLTAGICGWKGNAHYCINFGKVITNSTTATGNPYAGISGNGTCSYCINLGDIEVPIASTIAGIAASGAATNCVNVGNVSKGNHQNVFGIASASGTAKSYNIGKLEASFYGLAIYGIGATCTAASCFYDKQMTPDVKSGGTGKYTSEMLGDALKSALGADQWIYEEGMYPRLRWTDSLDWARDAAIAAAMPVLFSTNQENVDNVINNFNLAGCDSTIVWNIENGPVVTNIDNATCSNNNCIATVNPVNVTTSSDISASIGGIKCKTVRLKKHIEPCRDTLCINNYNDWKMLRDSLNCDRAFYYHDTLICRHADSVHFRMTADVAFPNDIWTPIGGGSYFSGVILGEGHTISNLRCNKTYSGLFEYLKGRVQDLNFTGVVINGSIKGTVCAKMENAKISNCTVRGSISSSSGGNTGGLVGWSASSKDTIIHCSNYATINCTSDDRCGGIVGLCTLKVKAIDCHNYANVTGHRTGGICGWGGDAYNCHNEGKITGNYNAGGIIGDGGGAVSCYNIGDVVGNSECNCTGGICGNSGTATNCYNVATIKALPSNAATNYYVGGICGSGNPTKCYNAGIVYGENRKYVGGIVGSGVPSYCYNSNTVRSTGTYFGAICGATNNSVSHCYYDKQLSPVGGMAGVDVAGKAEGLYTQDMLTDGMASLLNPGGASYWTYEHLLYPQLTTFAGTSPSISSVMPVNLTDNEPWNKVTQSFYMHGCDVGDWNLLQGTCVVLDTAGTHCQTNVSGVGVVQLGASVNDTIYRKVRLLIQVGEETPLIIKNLTELKNFRDVINSSRGFYNMIDQTYHTSLTHEDSTNLDYFLEIQQGGLDLYFKLITDIDMSGETGAWKPIGDYESNNSLVFQGDFNGDNHTITGLKIGSGNRQGLFGRANAAVIRNLTITNSTMTGSGNYKGLLCGVNYGGDVKNCAVVNSKITGSGKYHGALCGTSDYGSMRHCYSENDSIMTNAEATGGLSGENYFSIIDSCYTNKLYLTGSGDYKGGIVGYNTSSYLTHCDILNSKIDVTAHRVGGICGQNYSNNSSNPAYVQYCTNRNTTMKITGKYDFGGIVGYNYYQYVYVVDCYTTGGTITSNYSNVGGICGNQYYNTANNQVVRCINENPIITTGNYAGGITGYCDRGSVISCENRAPIKSSSNYVGGVVGYVINAASISNSVNKGSLKGSSYIGGVLGWSNVATTVSNCVNKGDVNGSGSYIGGIQGWMNNKDAKISHSYNLGQVNGYYRVGGVLGYAGVGSIANCYNAGIVQGTSKVGGIMGEQVNANANSTNSYNSGYVKGVTMVGGVCGFSHNYKLANCAYDKQMCFRGGVCDEDRTYAQGKLTSEMVGTSLQSVLGTTDWVYTDGMYPRLKNIDTGAIALSSALPVWLPTTPELVKANDIPIGHYGLSGCDSTHWVRYEGYSINFPSCDTLNVVGRNYAKIANVVNGDTLKVVQLVLGISEEHPLEIVSLEQFKKFRDLINRYRPFYYDDVNKIFYADEGDGYVKIERYGKDMFFKLTTDIDLTLETEDWEPVWYFMGHFNGGEHSVTGMRINGDDNLYDAGLFGYLEGTIKNLTMYNANIHGEGEYYGAIAGENDGFIENCRNIGGEIVGVGAIGGITGENNYGQISRCYNSGNIKGEWAVGGISGDSYEGITTQCFNAGLVYGDSYAGGIVSYLGDGEITNCYNVGAVAGYNYLGGIAGYSDSPYLSDCYNAGYVHSYYGYEEYVGAIMSTDYATCIPTNCFYDRQMSALEGGIGMSNETIDAVGSTTPKFTEEMIGNGLSSVLGSTYWVYTDSLYPRLRSMAELDGSIVSVQPIYITEHLKCDEVSLPFTAKTSDSTSWERYGIGEALNITELGSGKLGLSICGPDSLKVSLREDFKIVPLYVARLQAVTLVDTACDGFYLWAANGRVYTETGHYTVALTVSVGCDSVMNLDLTIPDPLKIDMQSENYTCYESTNAYAEATVTGGFGSGYLYTWTNAFGDTVGTTNRISHPIEPGTYHFSVRDAVHPDCEKSTDVTITKPTELVLTPGVADSKCYNQNDGYISFSVDGGTLPYTVDWTGTASGNIHVSQPQTDTISGLADGTYNIKVTDDNGCYKEWTSISVADDDEQYTIMAYGVSKMYDGVTVDPAQYALTIGTNAPEMIASGGYKVLANGDTLRASVSASVPVKDVCNVNNNLTGYSISLNGEDRSCRYNLSTHNSTVEIYKRDVILTSASAQKGYDGSPLTSRSVTVGGSGFATGEDTLSCTVTGSQTEVGSSANAFSYTLKDNTLASNYDIQTVEGTLVVATHGNVVIIANSATKTYDGTALTDNGYTYAGIIAATDTLIATVEGTVTDVDTVDNVVTSYKVVLKTDLNDDQTGNYEFDPSVAGKLSVTRRNVTLTTVSDGKTYDGTPLARPTVTMSGDGFVAGEVNGYSADQSITNAGAVANSITIDKAAGYKDGNYNLTLNEGTLTIDKRALSIVGDSRAILYDGAEHTITAYTAPNLLTGCTISGISYAAAGTTVGSYDGAFSNTASLHISDAGSNDVTGNYEVTFVPGVLTISQSTLPLVVKSNSNSFMYDGQPHTYQTYTVLYNGSSIAPATGRIFVLPTNDTLTVTPKDKGADGIIHVSESGKNSFSITLQHAENYASATLDTGMLTITRRPVELRSQNEWSTYTGVAIPTNRDNMTVTRSGYGFPGGEDVVCTITGEQIAVGSSQNTFTYVAKTGTNLDDYDITTQYGTLTVAKATLTFVAVDTNRVYGEGNPAFKYRIVGFVNGEDTISAPFIGAARPVLSTTATAASAAGLYTISIETTGIEFENYDVASQNGTLTIQRRPITVQPLSVTGITYDGSKHTWEESAAPHYQVTSGTLLGQDSIFSIFIAGSRTVAGTTQIEPSNVIIKHYGVNGAGEFDHWEEDLTQSYEVTYANGTIEIEPVEITLKPLPYSHDFNGHTYNSDSTAAPHYAITSGSLVGHDTIVGMTISGSRSSYGKTPFVIDGSSIRIVDRTEVSDYSDIQPSQLRTSGYHITLQTDTLTINHRTSKYEIDIYGKDTTMVYNGQAQTFSGWQTNVFEFDGFQYRVVDVVSKVENKDTVNTYGASVTGTARVLGAGDEDVTEEFTVTAHPGHLTISKKPVTVYAKGVDVVYDYLEHSYKDNLFPYSTAVGICAGHNIDSIRMTGSRTLEGRTAIHIVENSVHIKNAMNKNVTDNYQITLVDSAIHIAPRSTKDTIRLVSKSSALTYDAVAHTLNGFDTLRFMVRANDVQQTPVYFHIDPTSVSATTGAKTAAGSYRNAISGTPVVLDAGDNDVSSNFVVLADTGVLTISQRAVTVTARDTSFYYDGNAHNASEMHNPKYTVTGPVSGHVVTAEITSADQTSIGSTSITVGTVTIKDADDNDVTANYQITKVNGTLSVEGFPEALTIISASAELECDGTVQKKEEYTVTFGGSSVTAVTGSDGKKFALPTVNHDTLTITPTFAGISTPSQNADSNNTFSYALQNSAQYVGTRTTVFGTIRMYDSLKIVVADTSALCYGQNNGKAGVTISGGKRNAGNYTYKLDGGSATNTSGSVHLTGLSIGNHTFYVKDSLNYEKTVTFAITQPDTMTLTTQVDTAVYTDGTIVTLVSGGNGNCTYKLASAILPDVIENNHGVFNYCAEGNYTVQVTDGVGCTATASVVVPKMAVVEIVGVTRTGELTSYSAEGEMVGRDGTMTNFPEMTASGEQLGQPKLGNNIAVNYGQDTIRICVDLDNWGAATALEFEVSTNSQFSRNAQMYTHKLVKRQRTQIVQQWEQGQQAPTNNTQGGNTYVPVTEDAGTGDQCYTFRNLPSGTYYVRVKLYSGNGSVEKVYKEMTSNNPKPIVLP